MKIEDTISIIAILEIQFIGISINYNLHGETFMCWMYILLAGILMFLGGLEIYIYEKIKRKRRLKTNEHKNNL